MIDNMAVHFRVLPNRTWDVAYAHHGWTLLQLITCDEAGFLPPASHRLRCYSSVSSLRSKGVTIAVSGQKRFSSLVDCNVRYFLRSPVDIGGPGGDFVTEVA